MELPMIVIIMIIMINVFSAASVRQDEASLLLSFKNSSVHSDPHEVLSSWKASASPCSWTGVSCSSDRHVIFVDLSASSLAGPLHLRHLAALPSLRRLSLRDNSFIAGDADLCDTTGVSFSSLEELDLSVNAITGDLVFPSAAWPRLTHLNLSDNEISKWPSLPSSLSTLDLSSNNLSSLDLPDCANLTFLALSRASGGGSGFPRGLVNCSLLRTLDLSHNGLREGIPAELGALPKLARLSLAHNHFSGPIPPQLAVPELIELDLSNNDLSGGLPSSFSACSALASLDISSNHLSENFLGSVVSHLRSLKHLDLSFNNLTGTVPVSLSNCTSLRSVDLSSNVLTGSLPPGLCSGGTWPVEKFLAANNYLSGRGVLRELGRCRSLRSIDLSFNNLSGPVPDAIWRLPKLTELIMWANRISGGIPESICAAGAGNLQTLILNNNLLTGTVPEAIANCTDMKWLSLATNQLTGEIPRNLRKLSKLAIIQMGSNLLSGEIPRELGGCRSLVWLDLDNNNLTGPIPGDLSHQTGMITESIVSGKNFVFVRNGAGCRGAGGLLEVQGIRQERLQELPIIRSCPSTRIYSGMPIYKFSTTSTMIYLDLSYNGLSGPIPPALGGMTYLQVINLAHNALTGPIPSSFGDLKAISMIDLSHNQLQGPLPGELSSLSFLIDLDVSNNNLEGVLPLGGQLALFPPARYANNSLLCGTPLPPCRTRDRDKQQLHASVSGRSDQKQEERQRRVGVGLIMGAALISTCVAVAGVTLYKKRRERETETEKEEAEEAEKAALSPSPLRKLTLEELVEATDGFSSSSRIGAGGFGEVYKAQLKDGSVVAVKKLGEMAEGQGDREFMAEMETIGRVKHRNLVPLLGYCKAAEERALVYEYMPWGSLESVLHDWKTPVPWDARRRIASGSARALAFLHHSCVPHIIHRDMKSSNVLLDATFEPRVSDFGMARLTATLDCHLSVTTLAGTPGYVPPEYYQSFRCTPKGDVYSFGVVLLELLSRRRPTDSATFGEDSNLAGWARHLHRHHRSAEIFDPDLLTDETLHQLSLYLAVALDCLDDRPLRRPTMIQVLTRLNQADSCT